MYYKSVLKPPIILPLSNRMWPLESNKLSLQNAWHLTSKMFNHGHIYVKSVLVHNLVCMWSKCQEGLDALLQNLVEKKKMGWVLDLGFRHGIYSSNTQIWRKNKHTNKQMLLEPVEIRLIQSINYNHSMMLITPHAQRKRSN